ncbi:hypothetical protein [Streptomyces sulphureus]|uniref:hypothetical protein n=1 Tax=Streptomyces sulphureus TaxID=47758 RepID=UPI001319D7BD|nr:hypothetical protein [Streptomyces sulphureus]
MSASEVLVRPYLVSRRCAARAVARIARAERPGTPPPVSAEAGAPASGRRPRGR